MNDFLKSLAEYLDKEDNKLFVIKGDNPEEFIKSKKPAHEFKSEIFLNFNLRTIFEWCSAEWDYTTLDQKVTALQMIRDKGFIIDDTIDMYRDYLLQEGDELRLKALPMSIGKIVDHLI